MFLLLFYVYIEYFTHFFPSPTLFPSISHTDSLRFALFSASCTAAALGKEPAYSWSSCHSSLDLQHPPMTWVPSGEGDVGWASQDLNDHNSAFAAQEKKFNRLINIKRKQQSFLIINARSKKCEIEETQKKKGKTTVSSR